jgi:hypothetical protein
MNNPISDAMKPFDLCPVCGDDVETVVSFQGKGRRKTERKTQTCKSKYCDWSCIVPTYHEAMTQLGLDEEYNDF